MTSFKQFLIEGEVNLADYVKKLDNYLSTVDGEQQIWNTKIIINQSKYGKLFNQFPSRREK